MSEALDSSRAGRRQPADPERSGRRRSGERTPADLSSLLVEATRVLRGLGFYAEGETARSQLVDRAYLAFKGDLERAGPLELWIEAESFRATGTNERLGLTHLAALSEALRTRSVDRIEFTPDLTRDAMRAFFDLLEQDDTSLEREGGFARCLAARSAQGIRINGGEDVSLAVQKTLRSDPAGPTASLGSALLGPSHGKPDQRVPRREKPALHDRPLEAPTGDERGERLLFRLIELDRCLDDTGYRSLGERIVDWALSLFDEGLEDECYRAILVLASHATGDGGRSPSQARMAFELCSRLASGERLRSVIERACSSNARAAIRATQVLLQLGDPAIEPIFDRLEAQTKGEGRAQLIAILITMGEPVLPGLRRRLRSSDVPRARLALRLAGELQNPELLPDIVAGLDHDQREMRREAARALAHIGGDPAIDALVRCLSSPLEELPEVAASCLAAIGDQRATRPLLGALERALREREYRRSREMINALGKLGNERAVPKLVALLERKSLLGRRRLRELKLSALTALHRLPGREAERALDRITRSRDALLRSRAALLRRREAETPETRPANDDIAGR